MKYDVINILITRCLPIELMYCRKTFFQKRRYYLSLHYLPFSANAQNILFYAYIVRPLHSIFLQRRLTPTFNLKESLLKPNNVY